MMKDYLMFSLMLLIYGVSNAQEQGHVAAKPVARSVSSRQQQQYVLKKAEPAQNTVVRSSENVAIQSDTLAGETIAHCDEMIKAIDIKVAFIQADTEKNRQAEADGWYAKMARNRAYYVARREALVKRNQEQTLIK